MYFNFRIELTAILFFDDKKVYVEVFFEISLS